MNDIKPNHSDHDTTIEGDRDIPSIAQTRDYSKLGVIVFIIIGVMAIILVAVDGMTRSKPQSLIQPEETAFTSIASSIGGPYIESEKEEPPQSQNLAEQNPSPQKRDPLELQMAKEALRRAKEAEAEMQKRIASPQIVFDKRAKTAFASSDSQTTASSPDYMMGDDNLAFANHHHNRDVATAKASALQNLHAYIAQGTMIDGILETAIHSDLPGMTRAVVSQNIYSFDGSQLLIPKGSRLIGRYNSGIVRGQSRVFVIWNRIIRPDGVDIQIGSYGTDDLGRSGLDGHIDTKFLERFGSSVLLSLVDASFRAGVNATDNRETATFAVNTGSDFSRAAEIALENSVGIKPTIHIHQGTAIKVFVGKDLDFSTVMSRSSSAD